MNRWLRSSMLSLAILLVLTVSAIWTAPVLADDGTPPPPPDAASEPASPPDEAVPAVDEPAAQDSSIVETAPVEAPAVDESAAASDSAAQDATVADVIAAIPDGTALVVLDADGEALPLSTQEAADAILSGDPWWCPNTSAPGSAGCTLIGGTVTTGSASQLTFNGALLAFLTANNTRPLSVLGGTIWIESIYTGASEGGPVVIDGPTIGGNMATGFLNIKGGWNGLTNGLGTTSSGSPSTFSGISLSITNWQADVTLSNIFITGVLGAGSTALTVTTTKNITTTNVNVLTNAGAGASLDNTSGTGNVVVTSSHFESNAGTTAGTGGLVVHSKGAITLNSVTAILNEGAGAYLDNTFYVGLTPLNVTLTGSSNFSSNGDDGLNVKTKGMITLNSVTASLNGQNGNPLLGWGATLDNTPATTAKSVTLTGTNTFWGNSGSGLGVLSDGIITLGNVTANDNSYDGTFLDNTSATLAMAVTITNSSFNNNAQASSVTTDEQSWQMGLQVYSKGAITISDLTATDNGNLDADSDDGGAVLNNTAGTAGITLTGTSIVSGNEWGLGIWTKGSVAISNLIANANTDGSGAYIDACIETFTGSGICQGTGGVTLTGNNQAKFNNRGLHIIAKGNITINSINASNGDGTGPEAGGLWLRNDFTGSIGNVTLTGTNILNDNARSGLTVYSFGTVAINNLSADGNGYGASDGYGAWIQNELAPTPKAVTFSGTNSLGYNYTGNLYILSKGAVTLSNVSANGAQNDTGAYIDNTYSGTLVPQNVTLSGTNNFSNNYDNGLVINSYGMITLNNLNASDNGWSVPAGDGYGVKLNNSLGTLPKAVTQTGTANFYNNGMSGLYIQSIGQVTLSNVQSSNNIVFGVYVNNSYPLAVAASGITLNGINGLYSNGNSGLEAYSKGNILVNAIDVWNNGTAQVAGTGFGAYLQNNYLGALGNVTLTTSASFSQSFSSGLEIRSNGVVTITNLYSSDNGLDNTVDDPYGYGLRVNNTTALTPKNVSLLGLFNDFYNDFSGGVFIETKGAVTLTKITSNNHVDTNANGVFVDNKTSGNPLVPQNVTIAGYGSFYNNNGSGLSVSSYGVITMANINASDNYAGYGVTLNNSTGSLPRAVTITGTNSYFNNSSGGLNILSLGAISVSNLEASDNGGPGATLNDDFGGAVGGVTISGFGHFYGNTGYGLDILSRGSITLAMIEASNNTTYGATLDNTGGTGNVSLTTSGTSDPANRFYGNGTFGLNVATNGTITISNLRARFNTTYGAVLDNSGAATPKAVTLTGAWNAFTDNAAGEGLSVLSKGAISISNLEADNNFGVGALLDNTYGLATTPQNITLTGTNYFLTNGDSGLMAFSYGIIAASNLNANDNLAGGAILINYWDGANPPTIPATVIAKGITLTGTNTFNGNTYDGLVAVSKGAISANALSAFNNGVDGAYLDNQWGTGSLGGITLTGFNDFESNGALGLDVYSNGAINASNVTASWNTDGGAYLDNFSLTTASVLVTLTGTNTFNGNGDLGVGNGLEIWSDSTVTLNNITAKWNQGTGAFINNYDYWFTTPVLANANVNLLGVNAFNGNGGDGLYIDSYAAVALNKITADDNGGDGLFVYGAGHALSVSIMCGSMTNNAGRGYDVGADTTVKLTGVFAFGNTLANLVSSGTLTIVRTCP